MLLRLGMAALALIAGLLTLWGASEADQVVMALVGIGLLALVLAQGYGLFVARLLLHGAVIAVLLWKWAGGCGSCQPMDGWDRLLGLPLDGLGLAVHGLAALSLVASRLVRPRWRAALGLMADLLLLQTLAAALVFSMLLLHLRLLCVVCIATHVWSGVVGIRMLWQHQQRRWLLLVLVGSCGVLAGTVWVDRLMRERRFQEQLALLTEQDQGQTADDQSDTSAAARQAPGALYVHGDPPRAQVWLFSDTACPGCRGGWDHIQLLLSGLAAPVEVRFMPLVEDNAQMERAVAVGALSLACGPDSARWALGRIHTRAGMQVADLIPPQSRITHVTELRQAMHDHGPALRAWLESARRHAREHGVRRLPTLVVCDAHGQRIALFQGAQVSHTILQAIVRRASLPDREPDRP